MYGTNNTQSLLLTRTYDDLDSTRNRTARNITTGSQRRRFSKTVGPHDPKNYDWRVRIYLMARNTEVLSIGRVPCIQYGATESKAHVVVIFLAGPSLSRKSCIAAIIHIVYIL
jgi:hypothetical protein